MSKWLKETAEKKGITIEELREDMRRRSLMADKSKGGLAKVSKERRIEISRMGGIARMRKLDGEGESDEQSI